MADDLDPDAEPRPSLVARLLGAPRQAIGVARDLFAFVKAHPKAAGVIVLAIVALSSIWPLSSLFVEQQLGPPPTVDDAFAALDDGELVAARKLANDILGADELTPDDQQAALYVLGVASAREAETELNAAQARMMHKLAISWLNESNTHGFPTGREHEGWYLLGRSQARLNRFAPAIEALANASRTRDDTGRHDVDLLLATALTRDSQPRYDAAIEAIDRFLKQSENTSEERLEGALLKAEIFLKTDRVEDALAVLGGLLPEDQRNTQVAIMQGRLLLKQADELAAAQREDPSIDATAEISQLYNELLDLIKPAPLSSLAVTEMTPDNMYLSGRALAGTGDEDSALLYVQRARRLAYGRPLAAAAGLVEAEMLFRQDRLEESVTAAWRTARMAAAWHSEPWLNISHVEQRLATLHEQFVATGQFALAAKLAQSLAPLITEAAAVELEATTYHDWGQALLISGGQDDSMQPLPPDLTAAREKFRLAGRTYAKLATLHRLTRDYPENVWQSAQNLALGRDLEGATRVYRAYLQTESDQHRPTALIGLADAQLSLGQVEDAIATCNTCLSEFPQHPATYEARQIASLAEQEMGNLAAAKALLEENLYHESLTPRSDAWRDSLFALGELLYRQGREASIAPPGEDLPPDEAEKQQLRRLNRSHELLEEAIATLDEAVHRYPNNPKSLRAQYAIAQAHQSAAQLPQHRLKSELIPSRRANLVQEIEGRLDSSLTAYDEVIRRLVARGTDLPSPNAARMLRNSYFARGEVLFDMRRYEEAISAYSSATNRFQHEPAALEAYVRIASCYRRLGRPIEARGTIEQAKIVLGDLNQNANFERTTRYNRQQWESLLDWMTAL